MTLPRLDTWASWWARLLWMNDNPLGPLVPVPLALRAGIALALLSLRSPWSRALAAVIATPAFYVASFVLLLAPVSILVRHLGPVQAGVRVRVDEAVHGQPTRVDPGPGDPRDGNSTWQADRH